MARNDSNYCKAHKQFFCLCQASDHGLIEMRRFTIMDETFYFSRRDRYTVVFDKHTAPIAVLSSLPQISEDQAKWLTGIYRAGYLAGAAESKVRARANFSNAAARDVPIPQIQDAV